MSEPSVRFTCRPVEGPITQEFGGMFSGYAHRGVDFGVPEGTIVRAPAAGLVTGFTNSYTQWQGKEVRAFGIGVCIDLGDGWWTLMAHLSQALVGVGQSVEAGQIIAYSGNTGVSTGAHLHWQLSDSPGFPIGIDQSRDPLAYMAQREEDPMEPYRLSLMQVASGDYARMNASYAALGAKGFVDANGGEDDLNGAVVRRFRLIELANGAQAEAAYKALGGS